MTLTDQFKIIGNKIKANQAQYDLDRLAVKIFALSSSYLRKYEYLTGEDLGYKPSVIEQAKFDYSPMGNIFNTGLSEEGKKEVLFKRVENIEGKNEELLVKIKNQRTKELGKKDSQTAKTTNPFVYDQNHNFNKYRLDKFVKIPSIESKFDIFETFYKDFISLKCLKAKRKDNISDKFVVLNNASNEYNKLITKIYERDPKYDKTDVWKQKYDPENLKALDYQPAKMETK